MPSTARSSRPCSTLSFALLRSAPLLLALTCASAQAANFNAADVAHHGAWESLTLTLGDEHHYRAVDTQSYSDATLSVNATQGVCDLPWLEVRVTLEEQQGESRAVDLVPTRLRVDDRTRFDSMAEFITERGDDGFYVHFYLNDVPTLLDEMASGEQLFLGFDQNDADPWYMTFSLDGANEALARMQRLCAAGG